MAKQPLPSPEVLRQLLSYDPDTGRLFWNERPLEMFADDKGRAANACSIWRTRWAGKQAFTNVGNHGYYNGAINNRTFLAHRVIWAIVHGRWPEDEIDHINGIRTDNRIENLRQASRAENAKNVKGTSGNLKGASRFAGGPKWKSQIRHDGKHLHLGLFETEEEAHAAYRRAAERLHGKFASFR